MFDTIVAQATPSGPGAIALIRLSGKFVREHVAQVSKLMGKKTIASIASHTVHLGYIVDTHGEKIDQVLFIVMDGPKSFTGEDTIEITCHNNPFIINAIISRCIECGARHAAAGEFTQRAFENNKISLVEGEAINDLICAQSEQALKKALAQVDGNFSHYIAGLEQDILTILAYCQASFEFLEQEHDFSSHIIEQITTLLQRIQTIKADYPMQHVIKEGIKIALIGSVNAGKSSLFNALLGKAQAIVTDIAGTTRDTLYGSLYQQGAFWTFIDTAGIRVSNDIIEQEGIKRSYQAAEQADIVLIILDSSRELTEHECELYSDIANIHKTKSIFVLTKNDLPQKITTETINTLFANINNKHILSVSSHDANSIIAVKNALMQLVQKIFDMMQAPFLLSARQYHLIDAVAKVLQNTLSLAQADNVYYELISKELQQALEHLSVLTGKSVSTNIIDSVFRTFCVGK